jgi:hypothetical protein
VPAARVAFFANGSTDEELKRRPEGSVVAVTASDGGVSHDFWFNTYSGTGLRGGDRCKAKVKSIEVVVHHPEYAVRLLRFDAGGRTSQRGELRLITLPNIQLQRLTY